MKRFSTIGLIAVVVVLGFMHPVSGQGASRVQSSKVTIQAKASPLSDVLAELARKSGNAPLVVPDDLKRLPVTLKVKVAPDDFKIWVDSFMCPTSNGVPSESTRHSSTRTTVPVHGAW